MRLVLDNLEQEQEWFHFRLFGRSNLILFRRRIIQNIQWHSVCRNEHTAAQAANQVVGPTYQRRLNATIFLLSFAFCIAQLCAHVPAVIERNVRKKRERETK